MNAQAPLLRLFPLLLFSAIALLSILLQFNGLYGQDAHEYLRQSQAIFSRWNGETAPAITLGDVHFAKGYPAGGAMLRFLTGNAVWSLQLLAWLSFAASVWLLERLLNLLSHGSRADSRLVYVTLGLALSPVMLKSGLTIMSDGPALALTLAAVYFALRWVEKERGADTLWVALFAALAVSVRPGLGAFLLPLCGITAWYLLRRGKWIWLPAALTIGLALVVPQLLAPANALSQMARHSMLEGWSGWHLFQRTFSDGSNGTVTYWLPNLVYLLFPLAHPGFCLALPGLWLLGKRTDVALTSKKILLVCLLPYLLLIGGIPHQNLRFLLPVYAVVLLLFFPAWDRMYCYGFYFFKRLTWSVLGGLLLIQVFFSIRTLLPVIQRNRLEKEIATELATKLPTRAVLYAFDVDIALHSYLPELQLRNLWQQRYGVFQPGAFVLFNEPALEKQWAGQNPMLNWEDLSGGYELEKTGALSGGWTLYRILGAYPAPNSRSSF